MPRRALLFVVLYAAAVIHLSLYPWTFVAVPRTPGLYWIPLSDHRLWFDFVLNFLFYMPLGAAIFMCIENAASGVFAAAAGGFLLSFAVEWTQRYAPFRLGNLDDLLANTCGAFMGAAAAAIWRRYAPVLRDAAILSVLWFIWNGFLLIPAINGTELPTRFVWMDSGAAFFGFMALSLALKPHMAVAVILAFAPVPALANYPAALLVRMLAILAAFVLSRSTSPMVARYIGTACVVWLAFQQLYPFTWASSPQAFSWIPFQSLFLTRPQTYYPVLFGKLLFYTVVVWALRYQGMRFMRAVAIPATVLALGEIVQRFIVGRFPELTDLIVMATGAFLLWVVSPASPSSARGAAAAGLRDQVSGA